MADLEIKDLRVTVEGRQILNGIDLAVRAGEVHAIMGPNGSGKSTLSLAIMGHPRYHVDSGMVRYGGVDLLSLPVNERARAGLFLGFQYPAAIPGVSVANFLRTSINARRLGPDGSKNDLPIPQFRALLKEKMALLKMDDSFAMRYLNDGFSGGEKKRAEILQLAILKPEIAIMDETDSGLDIDALRVVAEGVNALAGPDMGVLVITHYNRILNYIKPHKVHVMVDGRIATSGGADLALQLEAKGYDWVREEVASR